MCKFNKEDFIKLTIQNSKPQAHRSKWTAKEDEVLHECISKGFALEDISKIISLRSYSTIYTKANYLGYGYKRDNFNGKTYFHKEINHKNRRKKEEILEDKEFLPVSTEKKESQRTDNKVDSVIIAKKIEINIAMQIHLSIKVLP